MPAIDRSGAGLRPAIWGEFYAALRIPSPGGERERVRENAWPNPMGYAIELAVQSPKLIRVARNLRKQDTWAEQLLWRWLRDRRFSEFKFRRQHPFGPYILDFFCPEACLNIELDGSQHGHPKQAGKDQERDAWLEARGIKVLRFWNSRLRRERQVIRDTIWRKLQERAPRPLPEYGKPINPNVGAGSTSIE